jgi:large subunit ribosomal protein L35
MTPALAGNERHRYKRRRARRKKGGAEATEAEREMPKLKTKSGAKKRFGRTGAGKIRRNFGHKRHLLINKATKMKRKARGTTTLAQADAKLVLTYMPYLRG